MIIHENSVSKSCDCTRACLAQSCPIISACCGSHGLTSYIYIYILGAARAHAPRAPGPWAPCAPGPQKRKHPRSQIKKNKNCIYIYIYLMPTKFNIMKVINTSSSKSQRYEQTGISLEPPQKILYKAGSCFSSMNLRWFYGQCTF